MDDFAITTTGLTRHFKDVTAVNQLDLKVPYGSIYGFLGPNGAGKTTTIRMLLGLIRSNNGNIQLFGNSLKKNRIALLKRVGALVESPSLYPQLTGWENLEVTQRLIGADRAQIKRVLKIVDLEDVAGRRVGTYSMGMCQRLGLALALLNEPDLLILDEPTNGLDPAGIREMRSLICSLPEEYGVTVFLSSHLLSEVEQIATHIGIIQKGKLLFQDTLEALHAQTENHVILEVNQPEKAKELLKENGWPVKRNGNHTIVVEANGASDAALINTQLVQNHINVYHLSVERLKLEDIFLRLTATTDYKSVGLPAA